MSCRCQKYGHGGHGPRAHWQVTARNENASAFNGYRPQWSAYSAVRCTVCRAVWRTKAEYVKHLPNAPEGWWRT
jgi:hypothetical protein